MRGVVMCCCLLCLAGLPAAGGAQEPEPWVTESRAAAQRLGGRLMAELTRAMAAGSPAAAIHVCSERAPAIAAEESAMLGARLGRTAGRVRNPANAPLDWQQRALESFARQLATGADPASLEFIEVSTGDGISERRWMKPIMTAPLCLTCHGSSLSADVQAALAAGYPKDRATGFAAGDLRGAFYAVWPGPAP